MRFEATFSTGSVWISHCMTTDTRSNHVVFVFLVPLALHVILWCVPSEEPPHSTILQASRLHSRSRKRPKSRIVSGQPGRCFTSTDRS